MAATALHSLLSLSSCHIMLTLLALAFSPPPVFTPAEPAGTGTVRNFPDASMTVEQEQVQSWLWDEEGEGTFGEEGERIPGPIESYAGDGNYEAWVAEFLKAEGKDGSYEARMDEFLVWG